MFERIDAPRRSTVAPLLLLMSLAAGPAAGAEAPAAGGSLADLGLEDLMRIEVTTVSRRPQRIADTAAAVSVLTADDIRRSGATSIPEALRLLPGVEVARIDGTRWAVSIRGFNVGFANKLLVLVDGRSVYSPLFSGTFWDGPDTFLEDIDRIEVIRGPGAVVWGSNAVNGVVNIITKRAADTVGGLVSAAVGPDERRVGARHGADLGEMGQWRLYAQNVERNDTVQVNSSANGGVLRQNRVGFRADLRAGEGSDWTFQGEAYGGESGGAPSVLPVTAPPAGLSVPLDSSPRGYHLKTRWERALSDGSRFTMDAYFDHARRSRFIGLTDEVDTWDVNAQHHVTAGRHNVIWGGGYRTYGYDISSNAFVSLTHPSGREDLLNVFAQDEIALVPDRLRLTLGLKLERSSLVSGVNPQPDARLLWNISDRHSAWIAASRANRLPSVAEKFALFNGGFFPAAPPFSPLPVIAAVGGSAGLGPEKLDAVQLGVRDQVTPRLAFDATVFLHRYKNLALTGDAPVCAPVGGPPTYVGCVSQFNGLGTAETHGFELSTDWRATDFTRLLASYSYFELDVHHPVNSGNVSERTESRSPRHSLRLTAQTDVSERWSLDAVVRYVDELRLAPRIAPYWTADVRLGWRPRKDVELSLIARNIFDPRRQEFNSDPFFGTAEQRRTVLARVVWSF